MFPCGDRLRPIFSLSKALFYFLIIGDAMFKFIERLFKKEKPAAQPNYRANPSQPAMTRKQASQGTRQATGRPSVRNDSSTKSSDDYWNSIHQNNILTSGSSYSSHSCHSDSSSWSSGSCDSGSSSSDSGSCGCD